MGGITTRRRVRSPSSSSRPANRSNSAIEPKPVLTPSITSSRPATLPPHARRRSSAVPATAASWARAETQACGATASASGSHAPSERRSDRRPHCSCLNPAMCSRWHGTRCWGAHMRRSTGDRCSHSHEAARQWRAAGKKEPYGKCENRPWGARDQPGPHPTLTSGTGGRRAKPRGVTVRSAARPAPDSPRLSASGAARLRPPSGAPPRAPKRTLRTRQAALPWTGSTGAAQTAS
eukprot:scaffold7303_cov108-Isochrysis_galbana.AAC.3